MTPPRLPSADVERVAARADVSTKTVRRYLAGVGLLPSTVRRVEAALRAEGLAACVRAPAETPSPGST